MRILLDECVHAEVKVAFPGHFTRTVSEVGWSGLKDGPLLNLAQEQFDVFVTIDRRLEQQQELGKFRLGFVIARVPSNEISSYQPVFAALREAAENVKTGEVRSVNHPRMIRDQ